MKSDTEKEAKRNYKADGAQNNIKNWLGQLRFGLGPDHRLVDIAMACLEDPELAVKLEQFFK